jgi:hypothetical protein
VLFVPDHDRPRRSLEVRAEGWRGLWAGLVAADELEIAEATSNEYIKFIIEKPEKIRVVGEKREGC